MDRIPLAPLDSQMNLQEEIQTGDSETKNKHYLLPGTYNVPLKNFPEQGFVENPENEVDTSKLKDSNTHSPEIDGPLQNSSRSDILSRTGNSLPVTTPTYSSSHSSQENNEDSPLQANCEPEGLKDDKINERYPLFKRTTSSWEIRKGKLTDYTMRTINKVFTDLERTNFSAYVTKYLDFNICTDNEIDNPTNMNTIARKLNENYYMYLSEFVHDIRHIIIYPNSYCEDRRYLKDLELFKRMFNDLLQEEFPDVDFQYVTGEPNESLGLFSLILNDAKETDENGDD